MYPVFIIGVKNYVEDGNNNRAHYNGVGCNIWT
jgi:hypothetical protein